MTLQTRSPSPAYTPDTVAPNGVRPSAPDARTFYRLDSRGISLSENWKCQPSGILATSLAKLLRQRITVAIDDPAVEALAAFEVERSGVPGAIVQRSSIMMSQLASLGFSSPIWHVIDDDANQCTTYLATFVHSSARTWARIHHRIWRAPSPERTTLFCELASEMADGTFLWSKSARFHVGAPSSWTVTYDTDATPGKLMAAHQSALRLVDAKRVREIPDADALRASVERHHASVRDRHIEHKVFVPLSAEERRTAQTFRTVVNVAAKQGSQYPEIIAEIDRIQRAKSSAMNGVLLLVASVFLFFFASASNTGGSGYSFGTLLILAAVLFVHEAGHWVAMRVFGYSNMKMFFIPFFGAAVSGRHYNVAGWKKAVVSLMGPLPGIILGAALGAAGVAYGQPLLVKVSLAALLLNGFNLLPILPLDGGWIMQAILFSRHHILELAFRIVALAGLLLLAVYGDERVMMYVAISMAISLPTMYKIARITNELRRERLPVASDDGQTIPRATADAIIARVKAGMPAKLTNKRAATLTLQIFENLNARPPGVIASLFLGILQFGSIAAVAVAAFVIFARSRDGDWHAVAPASISVVRTRGDSALAQQLNLVVADFDAPEKVAPAITAMSRVGPATAGISRFGQAVMIAVPFEDVDGLRTVQTALDSRAAKSVVVAPGDELGLRLNCTATSTAVATRLETELAGYLSSDGMPLSPPWQPGQTWTADERARYTKGRQTFRMLSEAMKAGEKDPRVIALQAKMKRATLSQNDAEMNVLQAQAAELVPTLRRELIASVRSKPGADTLVVDALAATEDAKTTEEALARGTQVIAPMLGELPLVDGKMVPGADAWAASGSVTRKDAKLVMPLKFTNTFQGAPAAVRWLSANGCSSVKYNIKAGIIPKAQGKNADDAYNREQPQ